MIRKTFLREDIWNQLGFAIKIIFLVASTDDSLNDEIKQFDDILLLDFEESQFYLPAKEYHFLKYIEEMCRKGLKNSFHGTVTLTSVPKIDNF